MEYEVLFDANFDNYAWELESKGCIDVSIRFGSRIIQVSFFAPGRLTQEVSDAIARQGIFFDRNVIVISKITRPEIEQSIGYLVSSKILPTWDDGGLDARSSVEK